MKKFLVLPVALAVGFGILILISNNAPGTPKEGEEITTPSGLKVTELKIGDGKVAKKGDTVVAHYTGWLKDGTKFQSSHDEGDGGPSTFSLKEVVKGWQEGIPGMKVGGKRKLVIPSELGYGEQGRPDGGIPPDAELTFEVELVDVK